MLAGVGRSLASSVTGDSPTVALPRTGPWPPGTKDVLGRLCGKGWAKPLMGRALASPFWDDGPMEATFVFIYETSFHGPRIHYLS